MDGTEFPEVDLNAGNGTYSKAVTFRETTQESGQASNSRKENFEGIGFEVSPTTVKNVEVSQENSKAENSSLNAEQENYQCKK